MGKWELSELCQWAEKIEKKAREFGLDFYPQEFEIVTEREMMEFMSYSGITPQYSHWSFGKIYDRFETLYKYGIAQHFAYEMVINSDPCLAKLLESNTLTLQILTMAHVYAHNNFLKNNFMFSQSRPQEIRSISERYAEDVKALINDSQIGRDKVESVLSAAHSLRTQRLSIPGIKGHGDGYNLLRYLIGECPRLEEWERELIRIVDEQFEYLFPQLETRIMDEGWASFWHRRIVESLKLPHEMHVEFLKANSEVVETVPDRGGYNPYFIGYYMFWDIKERWDRMSRGEILEGEIWDGLTGDQKIFEVMRTLNDTSFVEIYLTEALVKKFFLASLKPVSGKEWEFQDTFKEGNWENIRREFARNVGMKIFPVVRVLNKNYNYKGELLLKHEDDGRDLDEEYSTNTLRHLHSLWKAPVHLSTFKTSIGNDRRYPYLCRFDGVKYQGEEVEPEKESAKHQGVTGLEDLDCYYNKN